MTNEAGRTRLGKSGKFVRPSIWMSLSGGGLRAAIFHYGCLKRLNELGILGHVYAFSATSGGAIIAALLHKHLGDVHKDAGTETLLATYRWDEFEREFLGIVTNGLFFDTSLLICAYF